MKTIILKALRKNLVAARYNPNNRKEPFDTSMCVEKEVKIIVAYGVDECSGKPIVRVADGAVTGHESFYVEDLMRRLPTQEMSWCAGTPCRWDSLRTSVEETGKLIQALRSEGY